MLQNAGLDVDLVTLFEVADDWVSFWRKMLIGK